jgi:hypothetical protein
MYQQMHNWSTNVKIYKVSNGWLITHLPVQSHPSPSELEDSIRWHSTVKLTINTTTDITLITQPSNMSFKRKGNFIVTDQLRRWQRNTDPICRWHHITNYLHTDKHKIILSSTQTKWFSSNNSLPPSLLQHFLYSTVPRTHENFEYLSVYHPFKSVPRKLEGTGSTLFNGNIAG